MRNYGRRPYHKNIPKEYFCSEGTNTYIGKEYGFFIETKKESHSLLGATTSNYRSVVIVIDITSATDLHATVDKAIFTVTNLFELEFIAISSTETTFWRKDSDNSTMYNSATTVSYSGNLSQVVIPLYNMNNSAETEKYYPSDISFAGTLQNEQNLNQGDGAYSPNNDNGSYFIRYDYIYDCKRLLKGDISQIDVNSIKATAFKDLTTMAIGFTPGIGDATVAAITITETSISIGQAIHEGLSDKIFDVSNDSLITESLYTNRDDQIANYGQLTKRAGFTMNTTRDFSLVCGKDDNVRMEYTVSHSALNGQEPEYTRIISEIALKVIDRNFNVASIVTSSNNYNLREPVNKTATVSNSNQLYLLNNGTNHFAFTPDYSGSYVVNISAPNDVKVTFGDKISQGKNVSVSAELTKGNKYTFSVENLSSTRMCFDFSFDVSTQKTALRVRAYDNYIVKIDNQTGFLKTSFANENAAVKILNDKMTALKDNGGNTVFFGYKQSTYYVVIENNGAEDIVGNLIVQKETSGIDENKNIDIIKGDQFLKFVANSSGKHSFVVFLNTTAAYDFAVYSENGERQLGDTFFCGNYNQHNYSLVAGRTYYAGYENANKSNGTIRIVNKESGNIYDFYVDGKKLEGNILYLKQNQRFVLCARVNDKVIDNPSFMLSSDNYLNYEDGVYQVKPEAPITRVNVCKIYIVDRENQGLQSIALYIIPEFSINLWVTTKTGNNANIFKYSFISTNTKNLIKFDVNLNYNNIYTAKATLGSSITDDVFVPSNGNGHYQVPYKTSTIEARATITKVVFTQVVQTDNGTDTYSLALTNSYPNEPDLSQNQFYLEDTSLCMMFAGGDGSSANPYLIKNEWQLNNVRHCGIYDNYTQIDRIRYCFKVNADIWLKEDWTPIPQRFDGVFDGGDRIIGNVKIDITDKSVYCGFFSFIERGTVKNVRLSVAQINCPENVPSSLLSVGILAGYNSGTISDCFVSGTIKDVASPSVYVGGIAGINSDSVIGYGLVDGCTNLANIEGSGIMGGIAGINNARSTIKNCLNSGTITYKFNSESGCAAGIVGKNRQSTISNCTNKGNIVYQGKYQWNAKIRPCMAQIIGWNANGTYSFCTVEGACSFDNTTSGQRTYCSTGIVGREGE